MLTFYHAPRSRSSSILYLLEELGVAYDVLKIDIHADDGAPESYRAIHPHKKVPAIVHDGVVVIERAAICVYLADAFPQAGLAPAIDDPMRAAYLSALVYADAVLDPCLTAHVQGWQYASRAFPFGVYEDMLAYLERRLSAHAYAAGARYSAADTQWAEGLDRGMRLLGAIPERPAFKAYLTRIAARPAFQRYRALAYA